MKRPFGWGFLGSGSISATVAREVRSLPDAGRLVGVWGRDSEKTRNLAVAEEFERAYDDVGALLADDEIDAVYIALPHHLHVDAVLRSLDARKHVLCEKPLGISAAEVARILDHPQASSHAVAEGFMIRHHPQWRWIMEMIASGVVGSVRAVQAHSCLKLPVKDDAHLPDEQGLLLDIGCYSVHLARAIFRAEPVDVFAREESDTLITAHMRFDSGYAHLLVSSSLYPARRLHILGTCGSIEVFNPIHPSPEGISLVRQVSEDGVVEKRFPAMRQYGEQFANFVAAVLNNEPPLVPLQDAFGNAKALDAIRQSARSKQSIQIERE